MRGVNIRRWGNAYEVVDVWRLHICRVDFTLGRDIDGSGFYSALCEGSEFGVTAFEYDHKPTRDEVENDYIDWEAARAIDRNEARAMRY